MVQPKDEVCCEGPCLGLGTICELPGSMLIGSGSNSLPFSSPVSLYHLIQYLVGVLVACHLFFVVVFGYDSKHCHCSLLCMIVEPLVFCRFHNSTCCYLPS